MVNHVILQLFLLLHEIMAEILSSNITSAVCLDTSVDGKYIVTGDGVFDDVMEAVNVHLDAQYSLGRLQGADYARAYAESMQGALQQAVIFLLTRQKSDAEADLIKEQILTEIEKRNNIVADTALKVEQAKLVTQQTETEKNNTSLVKQKFLTEVQTTQIEIEKVITAGHASTLVLNQGLTEVSKAANLDADSTVKTDQSENDTALKEAQIEKLEAEVTLLYEKVVTESAQASTAPQTGTVLDSQVNLYAQQAKGFKWNADQKYAKTLLDAWTINTNVQGFADAGASFCITEDPGQNSFIELTVRAAQPTDE